MNRRTDQTTDNRADHSRTERAPSGITAMMAGVMNDRFVEKHGDEGKAFLAKLGIVRIPANQVTLHPFLLGEKFQKAADKAILRKNGVVPAPKVEAKK